MQRVTHSHGVYQVEKVDSHRVATDAAAADTNGLTFDASMQALLPVPQDKHHGHSHSHAEHGHSHGEHGGHGHSHGAAGNGEHSEHGEHHGHNHSHAGHGHSH